MTIWNKIRTGQWIPRTYLLMLVFVLHTVLRNHFAVALHVAMFVVGTLFVTNIRVKKPRNSTLAVLVGVVALAILKIFHIF